MQEAAGAALLSRVVQLESLQGVSACGANTIHDHLAPHHTPRRPGNSVIRRLHYSPEIPALHVRFAPITIYEREQHLIVAAGARSFNVVD